MPSINVPRLNDYHDVEVLYSRFAEIKNFTEPLRLDCTAVSWIDGSCTLTFVTLARLWFRWTGKNTILCNLRDKVFKYLNRLRLFDLQNVSLELDKFSSSVPAYDTYHPAMIPPRFLPGHTDANRQVMEKILDYIERIISKWFDDNRLLQRHVFQILSELGENVQHSQSYAYLMLQRYKKPHSADETRLAISIADLGIGIRQSLASQGLIQTDMSDSNSILRALEKGVTSTGKKRGIGLNEVRHRVLNNTGDSLIRIRSGCGAVLIKSGELNTQNNLVDIPGVQIYLQLEGRQTLKGWI